MKSRRWFCLAISLALCMAASAALLLLTDQSSRADGTTRYVATTGTDVGECADSSKPCRTVQYGVDVASEGDAVKIATGVYTDVNNRGGLAQIVHISKGVILEGGYTTADWTAPDPQANPTTLDAEGRGRVLYIIGGIDVTVVGLHITGGNALGLGGRPSGQDAGAGVYVISATMTLSNSQVIDNSIEGYDVGYGGGLYLRKSDTTLVGNTILGNRVDESVSAWGGGLYAYDGDVTLRGNTISDNVAVGTFGSGGGLALLGGKAMLISNTISDNYGGGGYTGSGGGVDSLSCDVTLVGNTISDNQSFGPRGVSGGGLDLSGGTATLIGNHILGNMVNKDTLFGPGADGLQFRDTTATLINNIIAENAEQGLSAGSSFMDLRHTTLAGNELRVGDGSQVTMTNTIVVSAPVGVNVEGGGALTMEATLWGSGPWANDADWAGDGTIITGSHNYWGGPAFVEPGSGDYHIGAGSAAIDKGVDAGITTDIDGDERPDRCGFDIGADEFINGAECKRVYLPLIFRDTP